jgi:hypothetical protein
VIKSINVLNLLLLFGRVQSCFKDVRLAENPGVGSGFLTGAVSPGFQLQPAVRNSFAERRDSFAAAAQPIL